MTTQTEITQRNHRHAVRFFWCLLIGATLTSLIGNIAHARCNQHWKHTVMARR
jgi:hypothetical protein